MKTGIPWHSEVLRGARSFITSWHNHEEEISGIRAIEQDVNQTEATVATAERTKGARGQGMMKRRIKAREALS